MRCWTHITCTVRAEAQMRRFIGWTKIAHDLTKSGFGDGLSIHYISEKGNDLCNLAQGKCRNTKVSCAGIGEMNNYPLLV